MSDQVGESEYEDVKAIPLSQWDVIYHLGS